MAGGAIRATRSFYDVGFDRLAVIGAELDPQTPIARIHARDEAVAKEAEARIKAAYTLGDKAPDNPLVYKKVMP